MKIAFLCHPYHRGGVTRWMVDFAIECSRKNYDVYFVVVEPERNFISAGGKETIVSLINGESHNIRLITQKVGYEYELGTLEYRSYINSKLLKNNVPVNTPVVLSDDHALWHTSMYLGDKYPYIGVLHADDTFYYDQAMQYNEFISKFVCVSERIRRRLLEKSNTISPNKVFTIPCGIILPSNDLIHRSTESLNLIYVGRIDEHQKRTSDLISIARSLRDDNRSFHLDIIGEGPQLKELKQLSETESLSSNIDFHGWLNKSNIYNKLSLSDILLLPSNFEGMPIAVMEALACGCAVVATRVSGVEDLENMNAAINCMALYEIGEIDDASKKIEKLLTTPHSVRTKEARLLAEREFSMDVCIKRYTDMVKASNNSNAKKRYFKFIALDFLYSFILSKLRLVRLRVN